MLLRFIAVLTLAGAGAALAHEMPVVTSNDAALGASYNAPKPESLGGPFILTDHNGRTVTQASWPGKWLLITFGFPGCRESCPVALDHMSKALELMGPEAEAIQPLFVDVSMDKKQDLLAMKQFVGNFHDRLLGLVGTRAQSFAILRNYMVRREYSHMARSSRETGPRINHTTYFYLVDPAGKVRTYFYHDLAPGQMVEAIRKQTRGG